MSTSAVSIWKRRSKMKIFSNITAIITCIVAFSSCAPTAHVEEIPSLDCQVCHYLDGIVLDLEDNPIEHIKVTADWDSRTSAPETKYTDSEGKFRIEVSDDSDSPVTITLTLEDIDGEDNGGLFDGMSDTITLFDNESGNESANATAILVYHLNRATASENSPRS